MKVRRKIELFFDNYEKIINFKNEKIIQEHSEEFSINGEIGGVAISRDLQRPLHAHPPDQSRNPVEFLLFFFPKAQEPVDDDDQNRGNQEANPVLRRQAGARRADLAGPLQIK